jgi:hypothetical protein
MRQRGSAGLAFCLINLREKAHGGTSPWGAEEGGNQGGLVPVGVGNSFW